jgi:hypothetical protein
MEEQIIFFTSPGQSLRLLQQMTHTSARHLLLVLPEQMSRLQVNLFLRLVRRQIAGQALLLTVVTSNRQARILAEQMGFASAATLDEAHGLAPGQAPTARHRSRHPLAPSAFPTLQPMRSSDPAHTLPQPALPTSTASTTAPLPTPANPDTQPGHLLREGYLPNPAAIPSLEEEAQRAAREEEAQRSRLSYEIADERTPLVAQEESEEHEAQIISTILKTSRSLTPPEAPDAQEPQAPQQGKTNNAPEVQK